MESNTNKNVLIGLSGGVDSAVAAYLLKNDGFTVKAATLKMSDAPAKDSADTASADAAASDDISDAAAVAGQLGIDHFVVDLRERFRESVINYFVKSYLSGETPNPCVFCNRNMKFPCMAEFAKSVGCGFVATGHYAVGVQLISVVSTFHAFFVIDRRQALHQIGPGIAQPFTVDGFVVE